MVAKPDWLVDPGLASWSALFDVKSNARSLFRLTQNAPQQFAPSLNGDRGIWTDDARFMAAQIELSQLLTELAPKVVDERGFADSTAMIGDFYSLRNRAGTYMNPITIPTMTNESVCNDLNLAERFLSTRDAQIFHALHHYMFRTIVPAPMSMRKKASSGAPYFTSSVEEKKKSLAVFNEYSGDILTRFHGGDLASLYADYGLFFATYMGVRTQPDTVVMKDGRFFPKPRDVNDEEYSRTGGKSGRRFEADKRVFNAQGAEVPGIFAMRRRSVYAYPAMYNYFLTQFFTPLRAFYLNDAEFTFKHRSPETIAEKLRPFSSVRGFDVKQFDQSIRAWLLDEFVADFDGFIRPEVSMFLRQVMRQPLYMPHPEVVNASGRARDPFKFNPCFGDPFDLSSFTLDVGLPSGIGPNPDMGKFFMTFAYLVLLDRHFHDVLEVGIQTILQGRHDRYALLDMGDDAVLATNDDSLWATIENLTTADKTFYVRIEPEDGISFLGNVLYKNRSGVLKATSNMVTYVRNRLCPEFGVQHWSRRDFCGSGWYEGKQHYSTAPLFGIIQNAWDDTWRKHFGEGLDVRFFAARNEERRRGVPTLTDADFQVLENPDKLYYRFNIEEIHPWVLDNLVGVVPFEEYFPKIERYFI